MTLEPLQKAKALYNYYDDLLNKDFSNPVINDNQLKQCALIAVGEIIKYFKHNEIDSNIYWGQVKQEIENL